MTNSNLLKAIINISKSQDLDLENYKEVRDASNRIQKQGAGLEVFIKDSFCGIPLGATSNEARIENYFQVFSDTGHANNPPDGMIRNGDAMEIKKFEEIKMGSIPLNSSPPRTILTDQDRNINEETINCEPRPWKRDYLYILGNQKSKKLRRVTFCYGNCFVACDNVYRDFFDKIKKSISEGDIGGAKFRDSREFGRIHEIDPMDFTTLRIRSMFELQNPNEIFKSEIDWKNNEDLVVSAIMKQDKFMSFPESDRTSLERNGFKIKKFKGKEPRDLKKDIDLVLVRYSR